MMAKMFVFSLGYRHYALPMDQATALLAAIEPLREVKQAQWREPWTFTNEPVDLIDSMSLAECAEPTPPEPEPELLAITHQPLALADAGSDMPF